MTAGTAGAIVQTAFEDAGLCALGQLISVNQQARGISRLNDVINLWGTQGLKLWLQQPVVVSLLAGKGTYVLGPGGDVNMARPLAAIQGTYLTAAGVRQPLNPLSRDEYTRLSQQNVNAAINSYFPNKLATSLTVSFWNTPDATAATGTCELICRLQAGNVVLTTDTVGFGPEWFIALRWALADELATTQPESVQQRCAQRAGAYRTALEDFDVEDAPTWFQPDERSNHFNNSFH